MNRPPHFLDVLESDLHLLLSLLLLGRIVLILEVCCGLRLILLCAFPITVPAFVGMLELDRLGKLGIFIQYFTLLLHLLSGCWIVGILMHILKIHDLLHRRTILSNICILRFEMVWFSAIILHIGMNIFLVVNFLELLQERIAFFVCAESRSDSAQSVDRPCWGFATALLAAIVDHIFWINNEYYQKNKNR